MSVKRQKNRNPFSRRSMVPRSSGKAILIVTEGEKTEPDYLEGFRKHLKLQAVDIEITNADGTDALSVVDYAIKLRDERKREVKRGCTIPYDSVWAVFDTERADTNPKLKDALHKAGVYKINVAISNPCFEFWLLLHDEFTTAPFAKCENVIRRIKDKFLPDYEKGNIPVESYIIKIPTAVRYAEQCQHHHKTAGTEGNPSTGVYLLVREMNEATREHFRLDLPLSKVR
ncbi:MAG: RloB family protein [Thermodesulfovibrionales bacterium]|nr:RloB family protein [Thermodesulfovibrionales bacterium]